MLDVIRYEQSGPLSGLVFPANCLDGVVGVRREEEAFSVEPIVAALKQVELGMPIANLIRRLGISEGTSYRWKKQYAGMQSDQVRELAFACPSILISRVSSIAQSPGVRSFGSQRAATTGWL